MSQPVSPDDVLIQARQRITARHQARTEQRWRGAMQWVPLTLVAAFMLAFFITPGTLPDKLRLAMSGVCSLRLSHSYVAGGIQLPLEARMVGIYGGFSITLCTLLLMGRAGAQRLGSRLVIGLLTLLFTSMVFDGVNSTLFELQIGALYTPTNPLRLITGLFAGIALAPLLLWLVGVATLPATANDRVVITSLWDIGIALLLNTLFGALVVSGWALAYYPVALLSVSGIIFSLAIAALLPIVLLSGMHRRVLVWRQLVGPGALALLGAFAFLVATAAGRWINAGMS